MLLCDITFAIGERGGQRTARGVLGRDYRKGFGHYLPDCLERFVGASVEVNRRLVRIVEGEDVHGSEVEVHLRPNPMVSLSQVWFDAGESVTIDLLNLAYGLLVPLCEQHESAEFRRLLVVTSLPAPRSMRIDLDNGQILEVLGVQKRFVGLHLKPQVPPLRPVPTP